MNQKVPRQPPSLSQLKEFADSGRHADAAALLDDLDLEAGCGADFAYYAGVCLGSIGETERAIALLDRAASGGYAPFWCAFHLGLFEAARGQPAKAAYYYTLALIIEPGRGDVYPLLGAVAPEIDLSALQAAQAGSRSKPDAQAAFERSVAALANSNWGAAVSYLTAALSLDPEHREALLRLRELAPDVSLLPPGMTTASLATRKPPAPRQLQELANGGRYAEAAALLEGVDLTAELATDLQYYAGVCLGSVGQTERAITLLKRAADGGYAPFWCAFHLGLFEINRGKAINAAYYLTVAMIAQPERSDLYPLLDQVAPDIELSPLHLAQAGTRSADSARAAFEIGRGEQQDGNLAAAVHYYTTALALDPEHGDAREPLLALAPGISLDVLIGIDLDRVTAALRDKLDEPETGQFDLERKLAIISNLREVYYRGSPASGRSLIPAIERVFHRAVATEGISLDALCRIYDTAYFICWQTSATFAAMRDFSDGIAAAFAAAVRNGIGCADLTPAGRRQLGPKPLRLGYLSEAANRTAGNAVGPFLHHSLGGMSRHVAGKYRLFLYAWTGHEDDFLRPIEGTGITIRRFTADTISERVAAVASAIAADEVDILITDANSSLPTVLFERRVAPVQIFYQFGLPYWPLANIDAVFRLDSYDPRLDGFDPAKCVTLGLGPWDIAALAPAVDPDRLAAERARLPQGPRLIGTYGRLAKITPDFLEIIAALLARLPQIAVILGGSGDGGMIRDFIDVRGLAGRLVLVEEFVDGHLWGQILDVFLDTFPQEGGVACREVMAKGRPVVTLRGTWSERERVSMLVADDPQSYVEIVCRLIEDGEFHDRACAATREFVASRPGEADFAAAIDQAISTVTGRVRRPSPSASRSDRNLVLERLVCRSVLDELRTSSPSRVERVDFGPDGMPVEAAAAGELLYLPALHLQVWRDHIVPYEANADDDAFSELQENIRAGVARLTGPLNDVGEIADPVCILSNLYSNNFFHCFEELYKVTILERSGFRGRYVLSPYADRHYPGLPSYATEFLQLLGIGDERILVCHKPTLFWSAWLTTRFAAEKTIPYSNVFLGLRGQLIAAATAVAPGLGPRLYLERYPKRVVVNRDEVRECVSRYGFVTVDMATLPVAQQIAAAHQAEILLGTHGSGMLHCAFLKEKSTVIECFSPLFMDFFILDFCHILQHRYFQIVALNRTQGPLAYEYGGDVAINCHHLELVLKTLG